MSDTNTVNDTLAERGLRYGHFFDHATISQKLKDAFFEHFLNHHSHEMDPVLTEALEMILHKLARIANGDEMYDDNYTDIAGYAILARNHVIDVANRARDLGEE